MKEKDISLLLKKADELRALFILGQRVIPFLEEIFVFVRDIQPLLDEINDSIQDNLKKMPGASEQLSKVTEANEMATSEIMDIVDGLFYKSDIISANVKSIFDTSVKDTKDTIKLLEILYKGVEQNKITHAILPQLGAAINKLKEKTDTESSTQISENENILTSIRNDASSIMIALQVQDITAQQIAAVNHMLNTIQEKLSKILHHFQTSEINDLAGSELIHDESVNVTKLHREIAFDPHAIDSLSKKGSRQTEVDKIMSEQENGDNDDVLSSQDDIDALFAGAGLIDDDENIEIVSPELNSQEEIEDDYDQPSSQDDIDAMFAKMNQENDTYADNDDIPLVPASEVDEVYEADDLSKPLVGAYDVDDDDFNTPLIPAKEEESAVENSNEAEEEFDIDTAFGDFDDSKPFSQDDIDAMFKKL